MSRDAFEAACQDWLPSQAEADYVRSLMKPCTEPGKFANWIAPPLRGINSQAVDFEYVKL
jgi:benzoyl-CoA 2,3-dioxygenase component B